MDPYASVCLFCSVIMRFCQMWAGLMCSDERSVILGETAKTIHKMDLGGIITNEIRCI